MTREQFSEFAPSLPHQPGVYKYFNTENTIIYIGKAKDLKKRVSNYFAKTIVHRKTRILVEQIVRIEFTIVPTEQDALLLESSLIKHFQPRYNIMLRDDKSYPHIVIKNEQYPRIFFTRRIIKDGSTYLGPYVNFVKVKELLEVIKQSLPIRTCNLPLTEETIEKGKYKACLEYHIGNCKAPCINKQSKQDYNWYVQQIKEILKGKLGDIKKVYTEEMKTLAGDMQFEKANLLKEKLQFLADYTSKSVIVSTTIDNVDVICIRSTPEQAVVNYMVVFNGTVVHSKTLVIEKKLEEEDDEILSYALVELREQFSSTSKEIIAEILFDVTGIQASITIPKLGDKKKLLELADQNVTYFLSELRRQKTLMLTQSGEYAKIVLQEIKDKLRLTELPSHIECFDNSNFQGSYPVAAMVCFKDGEPFKKEYRHFHIKTVEGINDFASMTEIVYRRYKRLTDEGKPLPQLVIIDGGKGQLGAALDALKQLDLLGKMAIVGLAKNVEEIFFPGDKQSLQLPYHSEGLKLIMRIRDEVHRFGITFHRDTRSKGVIKNELENIKGIGENTATQLLKKYKSVKKIKELTQREIAGVIGTAKARMIYSGLHPESVEEL
jgi:excinuclease ABC subunit C